MRAQDGTSAVRTIELVWVVRHPGTSSLPTLSSFFSSSSPDRTFVNYSYADNLIPFLPSLSILLAQGTVRVGVRVHYTRAETAARAFRDFVLPHGLALVPGRPSLEPVLCEVSDNMMRVSTRKIQERERRGLFVGVCGPRGMADDVRRSVRALYSSHRGMWEAVGGIEVCDAS